MARYIDADRFDVITFQTNSEDFMDGVDYILEMIDKAPTADVVPRSEVEQAKQEVAREIFEEIDGILNEIGYFDEIDLTELKKKYIGE